MEEELRKTAVTRHIQGGESPKDVYTSLNRSKKVVLQMAEPLQDWICRLVQRAVPSSPKETVGDRPGSQAADSFNQTEVGRFSLCSDRRVSNQVGAQEAKLAVPVGQHDQPGLKAGRTR
jgi:hypothetical protein